jgi:hypothetical protein
MRIWMTIFLAACGAKLTETQRQEQLVASLHALPPDAQPALPVDPPADGKLAFNTEYWLGSRDEEMRLIQSFGERIQAIQKQVAQHKGTMLGRGFHQKSHGCLRGELRLSEQRDPRTRFGVFASEYSSWPVIVRYSNGVGWTQPDNELDARGMAVKLLGVPGEKYLDDEKLTQDFLLTNSPTPVGKDAIEFMSFAQANVDGRLPGVFFLLGHLRTGNALFRTGAIESTVNETYWSGGPIHLGAHQAAKFSTTPCASQKKRGQKNKGDDYLAKDLADAASTGICATLRAQFQWDPIEMPIENSSIIWDEKISVPVRIGELVLPPQGLMPQHACDALVYHPWHSIAAHKPMGNHNRARRVVYSASQALRPRGGEPVVAAPEPLPLSPNNK